jgi:hypothetical protein
MMASWLIANTIPDSRLSELLVGLLAFGNVGARDDRTHDLPVLLDRAGTVANVEARAVGPPEYLVAARFREIVDHVGPQGDECDEK